MNRKLFSLIPLLLCGTLQAESVKDEYGLIIDAQNTISLFSTEKDAAKFNSKIPQARNAIASSSSAKWYINSAETRRICVEWDYGDGGIKSVKKDDNKATIQAPPPGRCLEWADVPTERYGTAAVYQSNDNVLNKAVVVVQPYIVSVTDSTYSDAQFYSDINQSGLAASLRSAGYDVILYRYLNTDAGVAFNAKGVKALMKKLEEMPNVTSTSVIGLSMGGVVARYALKELENGTGLHKVAGFVSFDAPHLGANLPSSITDNISRLLSKVDSSLCGLSSACREARTKLRAVLSKMQTKTYNELIIGSPSGSSDRYALLNKLSSLGHVNTVPTLAITNGTKNTSQGYPNQTLVTHYKLHRKWYNGGSKYFKVYTNPSMDNQSGGYANFYQVLSDLIKEQPHPITPYVTSGQRHSFVSTQSALAGSESNFTEVAAYPSSNEQHMTITYSKALKLRQWLDSNHF
ncbi:esterase/lipase family protein [Thalassomonas actiniarum]|uniref:DUF676 domain-containing protein n=1 Tax=Thalassomonas actiniarum TaxID=485447 RepID=A0AAE9YLM7_9GAMM|nr:hypothetical protein [Thalassomonas actiniarum]WDD96913.1 hypothetical protein SG35_016270 [Thalassomonas actiniarum]